MRKVNLTLALNANLADFKQFLSPILNMEEIIGSSLPVLL